MTTRFPVYLELGRKRAFAGAIDWPGWSRAGNGEAGAIAALLAYGSRYRAAMGRPGERLALPIDPAAVEVVERLPGDATTDFGAPGAVPSADDHSVDADELERQIALLAAAWRALDDAVRRADGVALRTGPRGGGRDVPRIVEHVIEAERSYLARLGGRYTIPAGEAVADHAVPLREAAEQTLRARVTGGELPPQGRRTAPLWPPRYFVRRAAWHALDHAWEIEDRV
jgi:hypothetical protein